MNQNEKRIKHIKECLIDLSYDEIDGGFHKLPEDEINEWIDERYTDASNHIREEAINQYYEEADDILYDIGIKQEQERLRFL